MTVHSVEVKVDAALIEQLRADYAEVAHHKLASAQLDRVEAMDVSARDRKACLVRSRVPPQWVGARSGATLPKRKGRGMPPVPMGPEIIHHPEDAHD